MRLNSFMSWIGGKKALRELIVTLFPVYYERYIEVFGGGGWVLFHKPPGNDFEVYNDFNSLLVNLYRCVRDKPQELMEALRYVLNSREDFDVVRATLARDSPASDVQKAAWFYQLIRYSYASGLTSFGSQPHDMRSNFPLIEQAHRRLATLDEGDIHDAVIFAMNELFQTQVARNAVKASISAVLAGEEQTLSLPAVELQIRNLQERQLELFQLIVSAGADCTDYDEELRQVNMAKTKLMAKKAELEKEQRGAAAFEERLAELDVELEQSCGALTDFDELTVRQLVSNIKVLDKDSLLICFKDGTEITQAMQRRQTA